MKNFKYFTLGYSEYLNAPIYGIYQPTLDCFIITIGNLPMAQQLQTILSSRYISHIVCLNTANNYEHNLIDNEVCSNWTLTDPAKIIQFDDLYSTELIFADSLKEVEQAIDWDIDAEKQWCFMCYRYLQFLDFVKERLGVGDFLYSAFTSDKLDYYNQVKKKIIDLMYFGKDFDTVDNEIINFIQNDSTLNSIFIKCRFPD